MIKNRGNIKTRDKENLNANAKRPRISNRRRVSQKILQANADGLVINNNELEFSDQIWWQY